jgi:hypothetical protein
LACERGRQTCELARLDQLSIFQEVVEQSFENLEPRLHRHHALDDAKANMLVYLAWKS